MIWDPVTQFVCLCKDGFLGERCEGNIHFDIYTFCLRNTKECSMIYRQCEMYNRAK